jgi:2-amino-4-hydroxy-6-hydroxymethyldihydropteridine diphosphokinase
MNDIYLLTGSNIGERTAFLLEAMKKIQEQCGQVIKVSSIYETAAWGKEDQESFLNQVLQAKTPLTAEALLRTILKIEAGMGRKRDIKFGPRIIDIDILFFNDAVIQKPGLHVPHPRMQYRRFVLVPLAEIAPQKVHPVLSKTTIQLLEECADTLPVNKFN